MNSKRLCGALAGLAIVFHVRAEEPLAERSIVEEAVRQNPALAAAFAEQRGAEALVLGERARYGLSLQVDANGSGGKTPELSVATPVLLRQEQIGAGTQLTKFAASGGAFSLRFDAARIARAVPVVSLVAPDKPVVTVRNVGPGYRYDGTLSFTQPLLRGFGKQVGELELRLARRDASRSTATKDRVASELLRDVVLTYWELWYAQKVTHIQMSALELAERQQQQAAARVAAGAVARVDMLEFATRVANLREERAKAELGYQRHALELTRLSGRSMSGPLLGVADAEPPDLAGPGESDAAAALQRSPSVLEAHTQMESARERLAVAGEAQRGRLDASGTLAVHGLGNRDLVAGLNQLGAFSAVTGLATLTFEAPLDSTRKRMERKRAALELEAASLRLTELKREVEAELRRFSEEDRSLVEQIDLAQQSSMIANELAAAAEARYAEGALTALDVVSAGRSVQTAELRVARLRIDLTQTRIRRLHLTGQLLASYARVHAGVLNSSP